MESRNYTRKNLLRRGIALALSMAVPASKASADDYVAAIHDAAARYGAAAGWMIDVMYCESGGDPDAVGRKLNINGTRDIGLFQINELTWLWWCDEGGFHNVDIWNPWHQIEVAAWAFANGYACHWVCAGC